MRHTVTIKDVEYEIVEIIFSKIWKLDIKIQMTSNVPKLPRIMENHTINHQIWYLAWNMDNSLYLIILFLIPSFFFSLSHVSSVSSLQRPKLEIDLEDCLPNGHLGRNLYIVLRALLLCRNFSYMSALHNWKK